MSTLPAEAPPVLGAESAGMLMTPEEFDAVTVIPLDRILAAADRFAEE